MLAKRLEERYASMSAVIRDLQTVAASRRPKLPRPRGWLPAAALGFLALGLAGTLIYIQTDKGTVEIASADDDVKVLVEQGGKQITLLDPKTNKLAVKIVRMQALHPVGADLRVLAAPRELEPSPIEERNRSIRCG